MGLIQLLPYADGAPEAGKHVRFLIQGRQGGGPEADFRLINARR